MDVWIASTKNTVSNNQRYKIVRNVDFKPFPSYGNGFLFEKVTEMVTAGRYHSQKLGKLFSHFFFASRNWRGLFWCVIAKMIAIGLHTYELSKLMGCVKVKHYISACSKV
ncbi:TPA: hypothetical protein ACGOSU_001278 [Streptococcus suis]